jgi:membrane associated rhomboid family serine protease
LFNLVYLCIIGIPLELVYGSFRIALIYTMGVIAGKYCLKQQTHWVVGWLRRLIMLASFVWKNLIRHIRRTVHALVFLGGIEKCFVLSNYTFRST